MVQLHRTQPPTGEIVSVRQYHYVEAGTAIKIMRHRLISIVPFYFGRGTRHDMRVQRKPKCVVRQLVLPAVDAEVCCMPKRMLQLCDPKTDRSFLVVHNAPSQPSKGQRGPESTIHSDAA